MERVRMQKIEEYEGSKPGGPSPYQESFERKLRARDRTSVESEGQSPAPLMSF